MKVLITLNFAIGVLLTISMVVFEKYELIGLLSGIFLLPGFLVLALVNVGAIFMLWRKRRLRAFVPIGTYVIAAALFLLGTHLGTKLILNGTPCDPDSFFNEQTKSELTQAAKQLVAKHQRKNFSPEIVAVAQKHSLKPTFVDDSQQIVVFGYYHLRHWFEYIWAKNGLTEQYSMPAIITMADMQDWREFKRIAKQGDTATLAERQRMVFEPSIAFPLLRDSLGAAFLDRVRNASSSIDDFTDEDKNAVLTALNKQRLASSLLVENPQITYEKWKWNLFTYSGLCVAGNKYNDEVDGFWESKLARQLLSKGVLLFAPDGRHLKIKTDLTEKERLEVEWLQVGLMNFIYGNLMNKSHYKFTKNLGGNWYFNVW
jgi:hypothetical protein